MMMLIVAKMAKTVVKMEEVGVGAAAGEGLEVMACTSVQRLRCSRWEPYATCPCRAVICH